MSTETQKVASAVPPVHQPGMFNIEIFDGRRWRGGMNRRTREDAIAVAKTWSSEHGYRHRVYSPEGELVFDSKTEQKPDVLAVMDMSIAKARDFADMSPKSAGMQADLREAVQARADVAELIAADHEYDEACRYVEIHGRTVDHERLRDAVHRRKAALARVRGSA